MNARVMVLCCPGLTASGREAALLFEQVLTAVTAFCPRVEAVEPGVCAFGARGPARYFGGEAELAGRIIAAVAELGVQARARAGVGVADGLFAAHLAAHAASARRPAATPPLRTTRPGRSWSSRRGGRRSSWPGSR